MLSGSPATPPCGRSFGRDWFDRASASSSQVGRFETEWLATDANLEALTDLSGAWIDQVHSQKPRDGIILDMEMASNTLTCQDGKIIRLGLWRRIDRLVEKRAEG